MPFGLGGDERIEQMRQHVVGHAGAVVAHAEFERQRDLVGLPGTESRMPGRKAVVSTISPSGASPIASAAFLTRLRKTWTSWSRLAKTGGSDGS